MAHIATQSALAPPFPVRIVLVAVADRENKKKINGSSASLLLARNVAQLLYTLANLGRLLLFLRGFFKSLTHKDRRRRE